MTTPIPMSCNPLDRRLFQLIRPLFSEGRRTILSSVWHLQLSQAEYENKAPHYDAYFQHYEEQCEQLSPGGISTLTHTQLLSVIQLLKTMTRRECCHEMRQLLPRELHGAIDEALKFVASALLLLNVSRWEPDQKLRTFCESRFSLGSTGVEKAKFPRSFHVQSLEKVAGIRVHWTTDIMQHLSLRNDDTEVALFHHVAVLDLYKTSNIDLIPEPLLSETHKTISLLVPQSTSNWFKKQQKRLHLDPRAGSGEHLHADERSVESFGFWRDRMVILKEVFDEHEPRGVRQFWMDDRNSVQWWTFWIALLVFLIAIIQCIEGALQVYKAYHPSPS